MSNETTTDTLTSDLNQSSRFSNVKAIAKKAVELLRPTYLNGIVTFIMFILIIVITRKLGLTIALSIGCYLIIAFVIQPVFKDKLGRSINQLSIRKNREKTKIITSTSTSVLLSVKARTLTGISILKAEWFEMSIKLNYVWDFLMEEGIQILDCREGCFLLIRKQAKLKGSSDLKEQAAKLVKDMEKTILLTKKKFDLAYENLVLSLVKGQSEIQMILHLGLAPEKFAVPVTLSEDDIDYLRNGTNQIESNNTEERELA